jgi:quinol-cytochrome oxidoreductase complex cytochrome b subunit
VLFWQFIIVIFLLTKLGGLPVRGTVEMIGQIFSVLFFFSFFFFLYRGKVEDKLLEYL